MRKQTLWTVGAIAVFLLSLGASRAEDAQVDCSHAETQFDLNVCSEREFVHVDAELNADYQKLVKRMQGDQANSLERFKAAQRAWLKFRDAECEFQGSFTEGGSIQPLEINGCLKELTESRVKDMQNYINCQEGDLTCPVNGGQ